MKTVILWFFGLIGDLIESGLTWKIYGDLSLFHFIFGFIILSLVLRFLTFEFLGHGGLLDSSIGLYKNVENKNDKLNYYHFIRKNVNGNTSVYTKYRVNRKTGEVNKLWKSCYYY